MFLVLLSLRFILANLLKIFLSTIRGICEIADSDKLFALSSDINSNTDITPRKDDVEFSKNRLFRRVRQESSSRRICNFFHMYIKKNWGTIYTDARLILDELLGYDDLLMASIKTLAEHRR